MSKRSIALAYFDLLEAIKCENLRELSNMCEARLFREFRDGFTYMDQRMNIEKIEILNCESRQLIEKEDMEVVDELFSMKVMK